MTRRLLILRAGLAACNNLTRALKFADPSLVIVGCNEDRFALSLASADRKYAVPVISNRAYAKALGRIIKAECIDLVIPNTDADVLAVSRLRGRLPCRVFLPGKSAISRCSDKYELTKFLRGRGFSTPQTRKIGSLSEVDRVIRQFPSSSLLWCRLRRGTGSAGAIPVRTARQAREWICYWEDMHGCPSGSFIVSEYLPGRDLTVQCLFRRGMLLMAKMHERLSYHVSGASPSGVSSTAALAKMIFEPELLQTSVRAIRAVESRASGAFFVDWKENAEGVPCITEINAGRFANVPIIHDLAGCGSMALSYLHAALDEPVEPRDASTPAELCYVFRGLDTAPAMSKPGELFRDIREWRDAAVDDSAMTVR